MAKTILVRAGKPGQVALWERDARHPNGEIYVAGTKPVEVYPTPAVVQRLDQDILVKVAKPAPAQPQA